MDRTSDMEETTQMLVVSGNQHGEASNNKPLLFATTPDNAMAILHTKVRTKPIVLDVNVIGSESEMGGSVVAKILAARLSSKKVLMVKN